VLFVYSIKSDVSGSSLPQTNGSADPIVSDLSSFLNPRSENEKNWLVWNSMFYLSNPFSKYDNKSR
jgi:hypothetical protein